MPATAMANTVNLLTSIGLDPECLNEKPATAEFVADTFDIWQNPSISTDGPIMGCICFRDPESDAVPA